MNPLKILCRGTALAAATAIAACGSAPTQFHTLLRPATPPPAASDLYIEVLPVRVPPQVDIPQLVLRQGDSGLALIEDRQWLAPLGQEIRGALAAELAARLGAQDVSGATRPAGLKPYRVQIQVQRFESELGGKALIEALWSVQAPQENAPATLCSSRQQEAGGRDYTALVEAHQRAVQSLAQQIADAISAARKRGSAVQCGA